jgi:hypothetical protein
MRRFHQLMKFKMFVAREGHAERASATLFCHQFGKTLRMFLDEVDTWRDAFTTIAVNESISPI